MAEYIVKMTNKAKEFLINALSGSGKELIFVKFQVGNGRRSDLDNIEKFETLINPITDMPISNAKSLANNSISLTGKLSNENLKEGFFIWEYGLFARNPETNEEFLYYYAYTELADWFPSFNKTIQHSEIGIIISVSETDNIKFSINETFIYPTLEDFNDYKIDLNSALNFHISDEIKHITAIERNLWNTVSDKVNKVSGKGLSTNDFTNTYKTKLDGISINANNYTHPSSHPATMIIQDSSHKFVSDAEKANWDCKDKILVGESIQSAVQKKIFFKVVN